MQQASGEYDIRFLCQLLQLPDSSFYDTSTQADDSQLLEGIETICLKNPRYGYRRVTNQLQGGGIEVGLHQVRCLMGQMGLSVARLRPKVQTTKSGKGKPLYPNLIKDFEVTHPNQVWCGDITFIPLANGKTADLAVLIDIFTRMIQGWSLETDMSVKLIDQALDKALAKGVSPKIHHSDHGGQYVAQSYCDKLISLDCRISMAAKGKPWENPYVESVIGHLKDELVWLVEYANFQHAYDSLSHFLSVVYNHQRPHSSLGYLTPAEFETQYMQNSDMGVRKPHR